MGKIEGKLDVVLVNPAPMKGVYRHQLYLPSGLAYLTAVLEEKGYSVNVLDCPALDITHGKLGEMLSSLQPRVVGITSMTSTIASAVQSARVAKEVCPDAFVVLGGPHVTFMDKEVLREEPAISAIVRGEGEETMAELVKNVSELKNLQQVNGLTIRKGREVVRTPDRDFIEELDNLPRPAYQHFLVDKYRLFGKSILPIVTSRGCPSQCSFCVTARMFGRKFRARNPVKVVDELEWLRDTWGAEAYTFYDDTFTLDRKRLFEILAEMKKRKINLPWDCQTRVDQVSQEMLTKMRDVNCQQIFFGFESGCQRILDAVNKGTTVKQNEKAIKLAKKAGLFVAVSVLIAYPGETMDALNQTLESIERAKPDDVYLCVATPYPGTELREVVEEKGWELSNDWSRYDTITPVFKNPDLLPEKIVEVREDFYKNFYTPSYVFSHMMKRNFYSRVMARTALNHLLWRIKSKMPTRTRFPSYSK